MQDLEAHHVSIPPQELRGGGWRAAQGDLFVYRLLPAEPALQFADALHRCHDSDEHRACLEAVRRHPIIKDRVDTLVGGPFSTLTTEAEQVPERVMWALAPTPGGLTDASFDAAFTEVYRWLTKDSEEYLVVAPLVGVELDGRVELGGGVEIDRMTGDEVAACLTGQVLERFGSPESAWVRSRAALRIRESFPIIVGDERPEATGIVEEAWLRWSVSIEDAIHEMRLFKPGQVWTRGAVYFTPGVGAYHTAPIPHSTPHSTSGVYELSSGDGPLLRAVSKSARSEGARRSRPLQTALRRFGFAGERIRAEDQLIDLVIAAEAIFLAGEQQESAHKLALRAALLLGGSAGTPAEVFRTMKRAYNARSKVAHGGEVPDLKFANGDPATLDDYVLLVEGYLRQTLKALIDQAAKGEPLPMRSWDDVMLARLDPPPEMPS
jgi:hypothetical protein